MTCEQWSLNTRYAISAGNGDIEHSHITFLRSENIPAMYIDTRSGDMGYIHADRNHSESGAMRLVTGEGETIYSGKLKKSTDGETPPGRRRRRPTAWNCRKTMTFWEWARR